MGEVWKPIKGYECLYEVSSFGRVRSIRQNKILKPRKTPHNYLRVTLPATNGQRDAYIHRLVAEAFCERAEGCNVVNHKDFNTQNNCSTNIEWTTQKENISYSRSHGHYGGRHKRIQVVGFISGKECLFPSARAAAEATGLNHKTILNCCRGESKYLDEYKWRIAEVG